MRVKGAFLCFDALNLALVSEKDVELCNDTLAYIQAGAVLSAKLHYLPSSCKIIYKNNLVIKKLALIVHQRRFDLPHFFFAKRPNFFSFSFLLELGSGGAGEEVGGTGRVWALAWAEGCGTASCMASCMAWPQRCSSSCGRLKPETFVNERRAGLWSRRSEKNTVVLELTSSLHWNRYSLASPRLQTEQKVA